MTIQPPYYYTVQCRNSKLPGYMCSLTFLFSFSELIFAEDSFVYPEEVNSGVYYFFNAFNFDDAPNGSFFIGAKFVYCRCGCFMKFICICRNVLYEMNERNLQVSKMFSWLPLQAEQNQCRSDALDPVRIIVFAIQHCAVLIFT